MAKADKFFDEKIEEIAGRGVVYDIGGCSGFQKDLGKYKELFKNCQYKTVDMNPDCRPDILADAQNLPVPSESADAALLFSVLEYVQDPQKAVSEIQRILKPKGKCLCSLTFLHPYHGSHTGKDYWRFSEDGIRYLFRAFSHIEICALKGYFETMTNFLPKQNRFPVKFCLPMARFLDKLFQKYQNPKQSSGFLVFLVK